MSGRLAKFAVATGAVVSIGLVAAPAANAATDTGSNVSAFACDIFSGQTYKSGNYINGSMKFAGCSGSATIIIQRSRWYGWEDMASKSVSAADGWRQIAYDCSHDGTYDYRTILDGRIAGNPVFRESNHIRVSC
jgi:hypothetical protein